MYRGTACAMEVELGSLPFNVEREWQTRAIGRATQHQDAQDQQNVLHRDLTIGYRNDARGPKFQAEAGRPSRRSTLAEGRPEPFQVRPAHRQHLVHGRRELDLPVGLTASPPDLEDVVDVHRVVAVDPDDPEGG